MVHATQPRSPASPSRSINQSVSQSVSHSSITGQWIASTITKGLFISPHTHAKHMTDLTDLNDC